MNYIDYKIIIFVYYDIDYFNFIQINYLLHFSIMNYYLL